MSYPRIAKENSNFFVFHLSQILEEDYGWTLEGGKCVRECQACPLKGSLCVVSSVNPVSHCCFLHNLN